MVKDIFSGVSKISFDCHLELLHYYNNDINTHVSNGLTSNGTHNSSLFPEEQGYWCLLFGINLVSMGENNVYKHQLQALP